MISKCESWWTVVFTGMLWILSLLSVSKLETDMALFMTYQPCRFPVTTNSLVISLVVLIIVLVSNYTQILQLLKRLSPQVFKPNLQEMCPPHSFIFVILHCLLGTKFGGHSLSWNHSGYPEEIFSLVLLMNVKQTFITRDHISPPTGSKSQ